MTAPTRDECIDDMRKMLAWLKRHPEVPLPDFDVDHCILTDDDEDGLGHIATIASDLDVEPTANRDNSHWYATRRFGSARYRAFYVTRAASLRWDAERQHVRDCMPPDLPTVDGAVVDEQRALAGAVSE